MPPKSQKDAEGQGGDWVELSRTLHEMQLNIHTAIQRYNDSLHQSMRDVVETILQNQPNCDHLDGEDVHDANPFVHVQDQIQQHHRGGRELRIDDRPDRRWESCFKIDLP